MRKSHMGSDKDIRWKSVLDYIANSSMHSRSHRDRMYSYMRAAPNTIYYLGMSSSIMLSYKSLVYV